MIYVPDVKGEVRENEIYAWVCCIFFSSRRRHTRCSRDWSSDVCSSDLGVDVERAANKAKINIYTARPGIVIGKRGAGVEQLKKEVQALTDNEVFLNIQEIRKAETNAQLVAENIATQLERRVAFRRAMKKAVQTAMKFGAKGIRVASSGRLGGAEMARYEWYREGRVPLHTLRADIEYGFAEANTTYGKIGVKCWIFQGKGF